MERTDDWLWDEPVKRSKTPVDAGQRHLFAAEHFYEPGSEPWRGLALTTDAGLAEFAWHLAGCARLAIDFESTDADARTCQVVGIAVGGGGEYRYLPVRGRALEPVLDWERQVAPFLADLARLGKPVSVHNAQFDLALWNRLGLPRIETWDDTMVMAWMSDPHRRKGLKKLAAGMLDLPAASYAAVVQGRADLADVPLAEAARYATDDTRMCEELLPRLQGELEEKGLWTKYLWAKRQVPLVEWVQRGGLPIDRDCLLDLQSKARAYHGDCLREATGRVRRLALDRRAAMLLETVRGPDGAAVVWPATLDPERLTCVAGEESGPGAEGWSLAPGGWLLPLNQARTLSGRKCAPDPHVLNLRSSEQMTEFLFNTLALPTERWEDVKKGINKSMLIRLRRDGCELADTLLKFSRVNKLLVGFYEPLLARLEERDGWWWVHGQFNPFGTATGRWSSAAPNLQNVPNYDPKLDWTAVRAVFCAPPGWTLVVGDLSQIELRLIGHFSADPMLRQVYQEGGDIHALTGAKLAGVPYERFAAWAPPEGLPTDQYTPDQQAYASWRKRAKPVNFGVSYLMGAGKFRNYAADQYDVWITAEEAQQYIDNFFGLYAGIRRYHQAVLDQIIRHGFVPTLAGRKAFFDRELAGIAKAGNRRDPSYWPAEAQWRKAVNYPIQSCLPFEATILTREEGPVPIGAVSGRAVTVWDGERWSKARVAPSGTKQKVVVSFRGGASLVCSPDHRFLCRNTRGSETWKTPGEFARQEYVQLGETADWSAHRPALPGPARPRHPKDNNCSFAGLLPRELGHWLGRVASDGSVTSGKATYLLVAEHEKALLPYLEQLTARVGRCRPVSCRTSSGGLVPGGGKQPLYRLDVCSKGLADVLTACRIKERIPHFVWWHSELLAGYLAGLFDGDGTANPDGPVLTFGKVHEKLAWALEVQQALYLLGIRSHVNRCADRVNVCVLKKDTPLFVERVGFLNEVKQRKLLAIQPSQSCRKSRVSAIYGRALRVASVELTDEWVEMYDVVDSETGRFMANGVVTHNSAGDLMVRAMFTLQERFEASGEARIISQVHDELILLCREEHALEVAAVTKQAMESTAVLNQIPLKSSVKVARTWLGAH